MSRTSSTSGSAPPATTHSPWSPGPQDIEPTGPRESTSANGPGSGPVRRTSPGGPLLSSAAVRLPGASTPAVTGSRPSVASLAGSLLSRVASTPSWT